MGASSPGGRIGASVWQPEAEAQSGAHVEPREGWRGRHRAGEVSVAARRQKVQRTAALPGSSAPPRGLRTPGQGHRPDARLPEGTALGSRTPFLCVTTVFHDQ